MKHISAIVPILNEAEHLPHLLDFFERINPTDKEVILIDGGSQDESVAIIKRFIREQPGAGIKLLHNSAGYVPHALNLAIREAQGDIIVRMDAHCRYAEDYLLAILSTFVRTGADIVGGPTRIEGSTAFQKALGNVISSSFGIGDSKVHQENYEGLVDSVTFGAWKRELLTEIGYFDERLLRNQDDEFHYRAKSRGKKIYLNPEIKLWYYPRKNFKAAFLQYFQYGYYKPLVLQKVKSETKARHLIPAAFVLYLMSLSLLILSMLWAIPLVAYVLLDIWFSFKVKGSVKVKLLSFLLYPLIHIAYGAGFLLGFARLKKTSQKAGNNQALQALIPFNL